MKPGDKVWMFDADHQKIVSETVIQGGEYAIAAGHFPGHIGLYRPGYDCFPTREALCEHYRKIFNREDMESTIKWHDCKNELPPTDVWRDYLVAVRDDYGDMVILAEWRGFVPFDSAGEYKNVVFYNFHPYDDIWEGQRCEITHWAELPSYPREDI